MDAQRYLYLWQNEKRPALALSAVLKAQGRRDCRHTPGLGSSFAASRSDPGLPLLEEGAALRVLVGYAAFAPANVKGSLWAE